MHRTIGLRFLILTFLVVGARPAGQSESNLLDCPVVIGASLSAGFGLCKDLEVATPFSTIIDAVQTDPHRPAINLGQNGFFLQPTYTGRYLVDQALSHEPTVVFAIDFLFWYGSFWRWQGNDERMAGVEAGLNELSRFRCPIVVGDIPYVRQALQGRHEVIKRPVIQENMLIPEPLLAEINHRIHAWAAERDNVVIVPLAEFLKGVKQGRPMPLPDDQTLAGSVEELLQVDLLHPRLSAYEGLALVTMERLLKSPHGLKRDQIRWSLGALRKQIWALTDANRQASIASRARRAELAGR